MVSPRFIKSITANIAYWTTESQDLRDETLPALDAERENILHAVQVGLRLPQTFAATAELALQSFLLVERRGYWREWMPVLQQLIATENDDHLRLKFNLLKQLGELQRLDRQLQAAVESHQAALNSAQQLADQEAVAQAKIGLSEDYRALRQYSQAEQYALMALEWFTSQKAKRWLAVTLNTLGLIAQSRGEWVLSEQRLTRAVALWQQIEQPTELARSLNNLALTLQESGKFEEALRCYRDAATLLSQTASELEKVKLQISLGTLYFGLKQWPKAEAAFKKANSDYLHNSGHLYYRALIAQNLGNVLLIQKRFNKAEGHLRYGIELWEQVDDKLMLANSLGTLGQTLAGQGQAKEARRLLGQAISLLAPYSADNALARELLDEFETERLMFGHKTMPQEYLLKK